MSNIARVPIATLLLIGINIAMAFAALLAPEAVDSLGFLSTAPTILASIACIFIHQNIFHLLANMVFLAAVGPAVEFATGSWRVVLIFLSGGICGVLLHWIATMNRTDTAALMGASGGVSALAAYYSIRYAHLRVPVLPNISIPILGVVLFWLGLQVLGAFVKIGDVTGGTAFWAHIGGFGCGTILSLAFRAPKLGSLQFGHQVLDRMNNRSPAAAIAAAQNHLKTHPGDLHALSELAQAYEQIGDQTAEVPVVLQLVASPDRSLSLQAIQRLADMNRLAEIPALRRLRLSHEIEDQDRSLAATILRSVIDQPSEELHRPDAIIALLELEPDSNPVLIDVLKNSYPLHPAAEIARAKGWLS